MTHQIAKKGRCIHINTNKINDLSEKIIRNEAKINTITANTISSNKVTSDTITTSTLKASTVSSDKITGATANINTIIANDLSSNTFTSKILSTHDTNTDTINTTTLSSSKITSDTIKANNILSNAITSDTINVIGKITSDALIANNTTTDFLHINRDLNIDGNMTMINGTINVLNENISNDLSAKNLTIDKITYKDHPTYWYINAFDFGAKGDGITDDTIAIQDAINAASVSGKNGVYVGAGTYIILSSLSVLSSVTIKGAGKTSTILLAHPDMPNNINMITIPNGEKCCSLQDIKVDGNQSSRGSGGGSNIYIVGSKNIISNVWTIDSPSAGILLDNSQENDILGCRIENNLGIGISQKNSSITTINKCFFINNGLENLNVVNSNECIITENKFFHHNGGSGNISVDQVKACVISNNLIDNEASTSALSGFRNCISFTRSNQQNDRTILPSSFNIVNGNILKGYVNTGICLFSLGPGIGIGNLLISGNMISGGTSSTGGVDKQTSIIIGSFANSAHVKITGNLALDGIVNSGAPGNVYIDHSP